MKNAYNILKYVISIINIIISILLLINLENLDILPTKYFLIGSALLVIANIVIILFLFLKNKILKILGIIGSVILIVISIIGITYVNSTHNFLEQYFANHTIERSTYNLIVLKNSDFIKIEDIKDKRVGYLKEEKQYQNKLNEKVSAIIVEYEDLYELYELFLSRKLDAILIDEAYLEVLADDYKDIKQKIRILYTYNLDTKVEKEEIKTENILKPMNIYISGSDSNTNSIGNKTRSDVNMIVTINPNTHEILLTSVPRDYYVQVHGQTGLKDKLTHAGIYGLDISTKTMEDLFDIKIDYSVKVGFQSVVQVVDLIEGIEVYSDTAFSYPQNNVVIKQGMNHLDGKHALVYARERHAYATGDRHRIQNQQQVLEAVFKKIIADKSILLKYDELLTSLGNLYRTDMPKEVVTEFVKHQLDTMPTWTFESQSVDGAGASMNTHTAPAYKRYVMIPYQDTVDNASNKIKTITAKK